MNKRERLEAAVTGGKPDRVPVSAWGHHYLHETTAKGLADITVQQYEQYDWDYVKVHARASYHVEGWGFTYTPSQNAGELHTCTDHPIKDVSDWRKLKPLSTDCEPLAEQIAALRYIRDKVGPNIPVIMTVFSPLDVVEKLIDRDAKLLARHIEEDSSALMSALGAIADTFARFTKVLVAEGVDGIYFSTKWANNAKLTKEQYQTLVKPFDMQVLVQAAPLWCNILHLCEDYVQLDAMADYPVQVFHWDMDAGHNPSLKQGIDLLGKTVGGGVDARTLANGTPKEVQDLAMRAIQSTNGENLLLGPGCSVQVAKTSSENLYALRRASVEAAKMT